MQKGELVPDFLVLIYVCKLNIIDVYISKRALKHFVESRSAEMINRHGSEVALEALYFIVDNVENHFEIVTMHYKKIKNTTK
jgi:hypothetical protein